MSFFFYDLETSGFNPSQARIMQFAGIRTDENLQPIGEPVNLLIKMAGDVLPSPEAIFVTGITPQQTISEGLTEAEFLKYFYDEVVTPDTVFLGFNTVRFDDEFMRYLHYRNFYDPYEWQWKDGCSRWDILDALRMTRALRPDGIEWPFTPEGKPTNRLELMTKLNGLDHQQAHDALSDVYATIAVAKLIRDKQPGLFKYLLEARNKKAISELVLKGQPIVYTSGKYPSETLHTTAVAYLADHPQSGSAFVFDLRYDPLPFAKMSVEELAAAWRWNPDKEAVRLPVKTMKYNRCPAVAPIGVLDAAAQARLQLPLETVQANYNKLKAVQAELTEKMIQVQQLSEKERADAPAKEPVPVDGQLYDGGFISDADKDLMRTVRLAPPAEMMSFESKFHDARLKQLLPLYLARNYPQALTTEQRAAWDEHRAQALFAGGGSSQLAQYFAHLTELGKDDTLDDTKKFLLEELRLYGEAIMPSDVDG
ncbi:MAG: exonuclease [Candidatus Saccharibacteria bacterium]|nr:exonuclease [Candidatus Saccharibacteria bacterium]